MKICRICQIEKKVKNFNKAPTNKDKLTTWCKVCISKKNKEYRESKEGRGRKVWNHMKDRCYNVDNKSYVDYGQRGIRVCDEWLNDVHAFMNYIGERPSVKHTIDRIDNDGNYEPGNVKWSTWSEQNINKRTQKNNTSGYKGVYFNKGYWMAQINVNSKRYFLGSFKSKEDAIEARRQGVLKYHNKHS